MKGGVDRWSTKRLLVFVENGYKPMTKAVPATDGSCIAGLKVCPVCVELDPSATNMPLLRKMPPKLLSSNDLMASTPTSLSCDTHTHRHTNKHTHTHTPHSNSQTQCGSAVLLESHSDKHPKQVQHSPVHQYCQGMVLIPWTTLVWVWTIAIGQNPRLMYSKI